MDSASEENDADNPTSFVLGRELSEVHLLLDYLAANPATNLSALTVANRPDWLPPDWIEQVCGMNWPPTHPKPDQAQQAALLIKAKDYLNSLSRPASGATVAFTLLVTQEEKSPGSRRAAAHDGRMAGTPSRSSLACAAYPDLAQKATRFRRMMGFMSSFLLAWLVLTCFLSWYIAFGNAQLGELATARANLVVAEKRVTDAELGVDVTVAPKGQKIVPVKRNGDHVVGYCERARMIPQLVPRVGLPLPQYESAEQRQACVGLKRAEDDVVRVERSLAKWLFDGSAAKADGSVDHGPAIAAYAAALANIMGSAMLPVLYGFLGAAAAIVRSLSRKTRASLLTPRDLQLSVQQLALGAVVGACIGLFVSQPGGHAGDPGLIGPVALSSSALSFIAGFGVDAVFQALETLIARIFNIAPPAKSADTAKPT